jgi:hypothetical protein
VAGDTAHEEQDPAAGQQQHGVVRVTADAVAGLRRHVAGAQVHPRVFGQGLGKQAALHRHNQVTVDVVLNRAAEYVGDGRAKRGENDLFGTVVDWVPLGKACVRMPSVCPPLPSGRATKA